MPAHRVVLLEYFTVSDAVMVFVGRADFREPELIRLPIALEPLRQFAAEHFGSADAVRRLGDTALRRWQELFGPLVEPAAQYAEPGDTLWLVPHDVLHRLPLHILTVAGQPLLDRHPVCYSPSATVMKYCRAKRTGRRQTALVVGDPRGDLPHARAEALAVASLFGSPPLLGGEAHKGRVAEELGDAASGRDVIHFACHGRLDREDAWKSGLALAGDGPEANLTAEEVLALRFRADLVTLSACESGLNEHRPGDELLGLTRALIYAGTPSVVVSLWAVHDFSTRLLMERFYQELRRAGDAVPTKAEALRVAQLAVRDLTGAALVEACERRRANLPESAPPEAQFQADMDWVHSQRLAGNLAGALSACRSLEDRGEARLGERIAKAARDLGGLPEPTPGVPRGPEARPFEHPFYWAPFVLVGDWR